jgi:hypothetical protein
MSLMVAAISPDPSMVFSGAVIADYLCSIRRYTTFYHVRDGFSPATVRAGRSPTGL